MASFSSATPERVDMKTPKRSFRSSWGRTMANRIRGRWSAAVILLLWFSVSVEAQLFPKTRRDTGPKPKNIHGVVQDLRGKPLPGARVFLRDMKTSVIRTLETDQNGEYKVFGLTPT